MKKLALVDFDGTLYQGDSMRDFARFLNPEKYYFSLFAIVAPFLLRFTGLTSRNTLKRIFLRINFKGCERKWLQEKGEEFFKQNKSKYFEKVDDWFAKEKRAGTHIVIVSGSCSEWLAPFVNDLGADLICTELAYDDTDRCLGTWKGENITGEQKVVAVRKKLNINEYDEISAFGNDSSDEKMAEISGTVNMHFFSRIVEWIKKYRLQFIIAFLALIRLGHFNGEVDGPHAWRQFDTKQYIEAYYHGEAEFLEPVVCWMGGESLALEFPLPEYIIAKLYVLFGPQLWVARAFFLIFFLIAAMYLYKTLRLVFENSIPEIGTLVFGIMPLSLFYSRAIHIDFFAIAFALAMVYYSMLAIQKKKFSYLWIAMACGSVALVVKAPYAFYFALPIFVFAVQAQKTLWFLKRSIIFAVPVILLIVWMRYSKQLNGAIPDWSFIPNFNKFTDMWYWYFGTWQQRTTGTNWGIIGNRILWEVLGVFGGTLFGVGVLLGRKNKGYYWSLSLLLGTVLYLVLFFNLNVIHNYYQLPFTICCAIFIGIGIHEIADRLKKSRKVSAVVMIALTILFMGEGLRYAEKNYYVRNEGMLQIARKIKANTDKNDRVIVSFGGLSPQCPLLLQPAGRYGWSIPIHDITPNMIYRLWKSGKATKLAVVYNGYFEGEFKIFFEAMDNKIGIPLNDEGQVLYLCDLSL